MKTTLPKLICRRHGLALMVAILSFLASLLEAKDLTLYVSLSGRDAWSGREPEPSRDGRDGPLATVGAALESARRARSGAGVNGSVTLLLRGGTYEWTNALVLRPEDSGASAAKPLTLAAYRQEQPVIRGGRRITGWSPVADRPGLWSATLPEVREGRWYFRQLFVNGKRAQRARTPNTGHFVMDGAVLTNEPVTFRHRPESLTPVLVADPDAEIIVLMKWANLRMHVRRFDAEQRLVTLSTNCGPWFLEADARYWVENSPSHLDEPGEWHLDRRSGRLLYWANPGEDLVTAEVIAPVLTELIVLEGDGARQQPVRHVRIEGITFTCTDWTMATAGYADTQAAFAIPGVVRGEYAVDVAIENCRFLHHGNYALDFGRGCQRLRIVGNEIADIGAGGLRLGEPVIRTNTADLNHSHVVTDNEISALGRVYPPAVGVLILQSGTNHVAHNHIHDTFYTAISAGWTWGYQESPCRENRIEFNHLHDIGQGLLADLGGIYTLGIQRGTILRNNLIHNVDAHSYGGWGLYTDEGSSYIVLENNVVFRCRSAGFHQHYGRENVVRNNILVLNRDSQLMRSRPEDHVSFFLTNNIVGGDAGNLLAGNWTGGRFVMDRNLYFDARPGAATGTCRFAGLTFDEWRKGGHDEHSVIADPAFVSPVMDDFRLQAGSPAYKMGFQPIDLRRVGPRPKSAR